MRVQIIPSRNSTLDSVHRDLVLRRAISASGSLPANVAQVMTTRMKSPVMMHVLETITTWKKTVEHIQLENISGGTYAYKPISISNLTDVLDANN